MRDVVPTQSDPAPGPQLALLASSGPGILATSSEIGVSRSHSQPAVFDHELLGIIGQGAYGEVWLARNALGTLRAVKLVYRESFERAECFEREFRGLQKFEPVSRLHDGLVQVLQIGCNSEDGWFYYVMEAADAAQPSSTAEAEPRREQPQRPGRFIISFRGHKEPSYSPRTLASDLRTRGSLGLAETLEIGHRLATALEFLHARGLVHRDIKPSNIIFVRGQAKLADIGLVADISEARSLVGTVGYIPPEGPGSPQADIYSLGKALYEAAFGKNRQEFPQLPADLQSRTDYDALLELNEIILKACECDPAQRYSSAEEMRRDLEQLRLGKSIVRAHRLRRCWGFLRRGALGLAVCGVALAVLVFVNHSRQPLAVSGPKRSSNQTANELYNTGRRHFEKMTAADTRAAAEYFERATAVDTNFAAAYAGLAMAYVWSIDGWNDEWKVLRTDAARRALDLDPSLSEPYIALGWEKVMREWNWHEAEPLFKQALSRNPAGAIGYHSYAEYLRMMGRTNEALTNLEQAINWEPWSMHFNSRLQDHYIAARCYEKAIDQGKIILEMDPNSRLTDYFQSRALCAMGKYKEAVDWDCGAILHSAPAAEAERLTKELRRAFENEGTKGYWRFGLKGLGTNGAPYWRARCYAQLLETNNAIECLQTAVKARDVWLTFYVKTDWTLDPIRSEPHFRDILKTMHLE